MTEQTITRAELERWIADLGAEANDSAWQEPYKEGWRNALVAVMIKMDDARKRDGGEGKP